MPQQQIRLLNYNLTKLCDNINFIDSWIFHIHFIRRFRKGCKKCDASSQRLLLSWPGTGGPGWDGSALETPAGYLWLQPLCCPTSTWGGVPSPSRCWHQSTGSLRGFWTLASIWNLGLSFMGRKTFIKTNGNNLHKRTSEFWSEEVFCHFPLKSENTISYHL